MIGNPFFTVMDERNLNDIDHLKQLEQRKRDIQREREEKEARLKQLTARYKSIEARERLKQEAPIADSISKSRRFKDYFCRNYVDTSLGILDVGEIVAKFTFLENIPVSIGTLIAIKIAKEKISKYCKEYMD